MILDIGLINVDVNVDVVDVFFDKIGEGIFVMYLYSGGMGW